MAFFKNFSGTPIFYIGLNTPTENESVNTNAFNSGNLIFFYVKNLGQIYWLKNIDTETGNQDWQLYPSDVDNIALISILGILSECNWFLSYDDPSSSEEISPLILSDPFSGIIWWNQTNQTLLKMTAYDPESENPQTWEQIL